jgi:hypothetical protein
MNNKLLIFFSFLAINASFVKGQENASVKKNADSAIVKVHPSYNKVTGIHRWLFGENYRREWAEPVKLPVIRLSQIHGGLIPIREGGGMQSKSLRLKDKNGHEWVLRTVEKTPEKLLPDNLQGTFAVDWVDDAMSGQHPFSALIVPPLAEAAGVPHANPIIGLVVADDALGEYSKIFTGVVCLLEEREPIGPSDNTIKMTREVVKSYDNRIDGEKFLRARMLDLLIGDWDRHEDQWRWATTKNGKEKLYVGVPRDRDQVFHLSEGLFPSIAALPWIYPLLDHFDGKIPHVKYSLFKTRFIKAFPDAQFSHADWMRIANEFVKAETDAVLEEALKRLPVETYRIRHNVLFSKLKQRRDNIPAAMDEYFKFVNRIVDVRTTDKDELVTITDGDNNGMRVAINKINKNGQVKDTVMNMTYHPDVTKELRLYVSGGDDKIVINTSNTLINLRVIDSAGTKLIDVKQANRKVKVYGPTDNIKFTGDVGRLSKHLSNDTANNRFVPASTYNIWMPLATAGLNKDDGFLLGLGFKYTGVDGFRKLPYSTVQQLMITHSFATDAFRIKYNGEWIQAFGKADFTLQAFAQAPDNTVNFFGRGNETVLDKTGNYRRFYRTRYDIYQVDPALRWRLARGTSISVGPSFQFYRLDLADNAGRFITQSSKVNAYDSLTINKDKAHLGAQINLESNHRDNGILPKKGYYLFVNLQGYTGLNNYSKSFVQIRPEFTYYQKINSTGSIVLSDRVGGGVSFGKPGFYQSMFLGGQGNLLGYLQNRFAGQHMVFNNLQARVKIADIASYIIPGQLGLIGFYDTGRVWVNGEHSDKWHSGTGGGLYFAPASLTVVQLMAGHSDEGWYPYISFNFRL